MSHENLVQAFFAKYSKPKKQITFKVSQEVSDLLDEVVSFRTQNNLSQHKSHFLRSVLLCALMCDDPLNFLPALELPDMRELITKLETKNQLQENQAQDPIDFEELKTITPKNEEQELENSKP